MKISQYREIFEDFATWFPWWLYLLVFAVTYYSYIASDESFRKILKRIFLFSVLFTLLYWLISYTFFFIGSQRKVSDYSLVLWFIDFVGKFLRMFSFIFFVSVIILFTIEIVKLIKGTPFNPLSDEWHPDHFSTDPLSELVWAMNKNLQTEKFDKIMKSIELGIHDLQSKKTKLERVLTKWKTVHKPHKEEESTGWRADYYSRETLADYERIILDKIAYIEDALVQCNMRLNDVIDMATKHKGFAKSIDIADFDGINITPSQNINKQIGE